MDITAIIAAGGNSSRMNGRNKLLEKVGGKTLLVRTTEAFIKVGQISQIILVAAEESVETYMKELLEAGCLEKVKIVNGGRDRRESVYFGLMEADPKTRLVVIHDAARPLVTKSLILDCIEAAERHGACCAAVPLTDTLKKADSKGFVKRTLSRDNLFRIQTPQVFKYKDILKLHKKAAFRSLKVTDDAQIAEYFGYHVFLVESDVSNIKVTTPEDIIIADALLAGRDDADALLAGRDDTDALLAGRDDADALLAGRDDADALLAGRDDADALLAGRDDADALLAGCDDAGAHDTLAAAEHGELFTGGGGETDTTDIDGQ